MTSSPRRFGEDSPDFVRALARGLAVVESFETAATSLSLTEVASKTGLTRGSARRFLLTLEFLGYVRQQAGRFSLQPRTLRLGYAYLASQDVWRLVSPILENIVEKTGESTSVCSLDGTDVVYVARAMSPRLINSVLGIGARLPAHATATGKVLLAGLSEEALTHYFERAELRAFTKYTITSERELRSALEQVRRDGWALSDQEVELGLVSIAAPAMDNAQNWIAALNIASTRSNTASSLKRAHSDMLIEAAAEITKLIRWHSNR